MNFVFFTKFFFYAILYIGGNNILIPNQKIEIKWNNTNKDWYESLGYTNYKHGEKIVVNAEDLSHGSSARINVICDYCKQTYNTQYTVYYNAHNKYPKDCCPSCTGKKTSEVTLEKRRRKYFTLLQEKCTEKGYILLTNENEYVDLHMSIRYICPKHGEKKGLLDNLIRGHGCVDCRNEYTATQLKKDIDDVEEYINSYNNNKLLNKEDFKNVITNNLKILCNCGNIFITSFVNYQKHNVRKCRSCSASQSKHEERISKLLTDNNIYYICEKRFDDCRDKKPLPFDFYLPDFNLIIEYDGEGHYLKQFYEWHCNNPDDYLHDRQRKDLIKTQYCERNNIHLLRIPYWEGDNLEKIILEKLHNLDRRYSLVS